MADWSSLPAGTRVEFFHDHLTDRDALVARLEPFEVVVAMRERTAFPRALLERLPNLGLLVTTGPFNAAIDLAAAADHGVVVCGTGGTAAATAELTWGLILAAARHIPLEDAGVRAGRWQQTIGPELHGKTLAVLGLGRLGGQIARVGNAFGMDVVAWSENLTDERCAQVGGVTRVEKDELFARADVLTIHLVLSDRTRGLVAERELRLMKPTALLVNTSRGPIVDEHALARALREGVIASAALDVFEEEPLPDHHPLRAAPNTVLTPHLGYVTEDTYRVFYRDAVDDIAAFLAGTPKRIVEPRS
ncbi:MAG TPA: D-2-hydroxyacid dehydrogenase family protein [Acidimicrobiia bacterium]